MNDLEGFNLSPLDPGTTLIVETERSVYRIEIVKGKEALITNESSEKHRFEETTPVNIHGSTWGGTMLKIDWIGKEMHIELSYKKGDETKVFISSPVKDVEMIAPDRSWSYKMDWNK